MFVLAVIGSSVMYLLFGWLASAIIASLFSGEKGYGERPGLATGLLLSVVGVIVWLVWPARADSRWKLQGVFGRGGSGETVAEARARGVGHDDSA